MPFYEYQCDACGHRLEALQKVADAPLRACPQCGGEGLRKLISRAAFRLKGTGWYETDFKNSGAKDKDGKADDKTNGKDGGKDGDKGSDKGNDKTGGKGAKDAKSETAGTKDNASKKPPSSAPMNKSA